MNSIKIFVLKLKKLGRFLKLLKLEPAHLFFPAVLALLAAVFEAFVFALLIPTIRGLLEMDFQFVYKIKFLGAVFSAFPQFFSVRNGAIFAFLVLLIFSSAILRSSFSYFSSLIITHHVRQLSHEMRCSIFDTYMGFKKSFFDKNSTGRIQGILMGDTERIASEFRSFQMVLYHIFVLIAYVVVLLVISWKLTLVAFLMVPILLNLFNVLISQIKKGSEKFSGEFSVLNKKIANSLACIPLVKASCAELREKEWFRHISSNVRSQQVSMDVRVLLLPPIQEVFVLAVTLMLTGIMAYLVIKCKEGTVSSFLIFFIIFRRATTSLGTIVAFQANLASVFGSLREVLKVYHDEKICSENTGGEMFGRLKQGITFHNLSFQYFNQRVLNNVSFEVRKGQMVALVGKTGSGKSTIAQLLVRFYDPPLGSILVDGQDILDLEIKSWRKKIAFVSQDSYFFDASIEINLTYGCETVPTKQEMIAALEKAQLGELLKKLPEGLATEIGERGVQLSGGEKQRLSLARVVLRNPEVLILDEATSALDSQTEQLVQRAIDQAIQGRTSIVIAHRLTTIQKADLIVVLDDGKIAEMGSFNELIALNGRFKSYWALQEFKG